MTRRQLILAAIASLLLPFATAAAEKGTREKILGAGEEWQDKYDESKPEQELIDVLKARFGPDVRIDVYLGLWCKDSRNHVPVFIRIMDELKLPAAANYYETGRKSQPDQKYFVEELKVERVPTFIVYRGNKEIGRIIENPQTTLIDDMIQILS